MLSQNDLYDLYYAFVCMRNHADDVVNRDILAGISNVLNDGQASFEDNQIRKAIACLEGLHHDWHYVHHNNVYVTQRILKNREVYQLFSTVCCESVKLLDTCQTEQFCALMDAVHALPLILADNHLLIPRSYWKTYIKPYRKKWDQGFLKLEEKQYKKCYK